MYPQNHKNRKKQKKNSKKRENRENSREISKSLKSCEKMHKIAKMSKIFEVTKIVTTAKNAKIRQKSIKKKCINELREFQGEFSSKLLSFVAHLNHSVSVIFCSSIETYYINQSNAWPAVVKVSPEPLLYK